MSYAILLENLQMWLKNMLKKSKKLGKSILAKVEIQNISNYGIWLLIDEKEFFMPFDEFSWFLKANIEQIYNVEFFHDKHLHWPDLESIKHPHLYPLKFL